MDKSTGSKQNQIQESRHSLRGKILHGPVLLDRASGVRCVAMEPTIGTSRNAKPTTRPNLPWRYWKTPVLFGAGLCILQILVAIVRFAGREGWNPAILFEIPAILLGLAMFFLCGLMVGLLVQRRKVKIFSRPTSLYCATSCNRHGKQKSALVEPQCFPPLRLST